MAQKATKTSVWKRVAAPAAGVFAFLLVIFLINAQYFIAQFMYHYAPPPAAVTATSGSAHDNESKQAKTVAPDPKVIIPSISVNAPVVYGMNITVERDVQHALYNGVLHFADTPEPGQPGNGVYIGHSSNVPWVPGNYKFVFTMLENVKIGEVFYLNHDSKQYVYRVVSRKIVSPYDVSVMNGTDRPTATLITCTPVGTANKRLVLLGEQISPAPTSGEAHNSTVRPTILPGN